MKKKIAVFVVVVLALAASCWMWFSAGGIASIEAVVRGRAVTVIAAVPGTVKEIYVAAGEAVAAGQPLLALDTSGMERRLAEERARLAELAASLPPDMLVPSPQGASPVAPGKPLAALRTEEEEARRQVEIAAGVYAAANTAFARLDGGASPEYAKPDPKRQAALITRDEAALRLKNARDAYEKTSYARAQREMREKQEQANGPLSAALAARLAEYQVQISRVRLVEQDIAAAVLTAPENGTVISMAVNPGDMVQAGDVPVDITPTETGELWVLASFAKEDQAQLAEGLACEITLPASAVSAGGTLGRVVPGAETEKKVAVRVNLDQNSLSAEFAPGQVVSVSVLPGDGFVAKIRALLR